MKQLYTTHTLTTARRPGTRKSDSHVLKICGMRSAAQQKSTAVTKQAVRSGVTWPPFLSYLTFPFGAAVGVPDVKNYKWRLNPVWHGMLYSCAHSNSGRQGLMLHIIPIMIPMAALSSFLAAY